MLMRAMRGSPARLAFISFLLLLVSSVLAQVPVPPLKSRVTDFTGTLSSAQQDLLERKLAAFEARKGSQVAVLVVPTTKPEAVEQYAVRVQETWKLGRKGVDDGVLMLVAKDDRKLWIEVGYGLEGVLTDAATKRIIDEEIVPRFKQGDFPGGITAGIDRILRVIDGEPLPPPKRKPAPKSGIDFESLLIFVFILVVVIGGILRAIFGRFFGSAIIGIATALVALSIAGVALAVVFGIAAFIVSLFGGTGLSRGGWGGGNWSSGGGGFGGGFSGGGGSSGGGGAGGSW